MSGLFGLVALEPGIDKQEMGALFLRMGQALMHSPIDHIDTFAQTDRGVYIGRVGLPHLHRNGWPAEKYAHPTCGDRDSPRGHLDFVAGVIHQATILADTGHDSLELVGGLRGFFSIIRVDEQHIVIAVDRHASIPIYFAVVDGFLVFAPETIPLLQYSGLPRLIDAGALGSFLTAGFLPPDLTLLSSVRRLRGGQAIVIEQGRFHIQEYWHYRPGSRNVKSGPLELEEKLGDLIERSVERNIGDPEKTVLFLSGGFDSRAILGGCLKAIGKDRSRLQTLSWGIGGGSADSDVAIAQRLAANFGFQHLLIERRNDDYAKRFHEVNGLIGAQSDMAAFHPHEYTVMQELQARGIERVLRGDECFGWLHQVNSTAGALASIGLRRFRDAANGALFLNPRSYAVLVDAADSAMLPLESEARGMTPNQAKDYFYFSARLQGYLNTASYYKLCVLDQRNVLLDEDIIDFLEEVPDHWRIEKRLFRNAVRRRFPSLYEIPIAKENNLENWGDLLAREGSHVRNFALEQLGDEKSNVWEWFDREACQRFVSNLKKSDLRSDGIEVRRVLMDAFLDLPHWMRGPVQARRIGRQGYSLRPVSMLLRILALKDFFDRL